MGAGGSWDPLIDKFQRAHAQKPFGNFHCMPTRRSAVVDIQPKHQCYVFKPSSNIIGVPYFSGWDWMSNNLTFSNRDVFLLYYAGFHGKAISL